MSPRKKSPRLELLCISCSGGEADENGASTLCALCLLGAPAATYEPAASLALPVRPGRTNRPGRKRQPLELLCIHCSGGKADENGAHTVCALCLVGGAVPEAA